MNKAALVCRLYHYAGAGSLSISDASALLAEDSKKIPLHPGKRFYMDFSKSEIDVGPYEETFKADFSMLLRDVRRSEHGYHEMQYGDRMCRANERVSAVDEQNALWSEIEGQLAAQPRGKRDMLRQIEVVKRALEDISAVAYSHAGDRFPDPKHPEKNNAIDLVAAIAGYLPHHDDFWIGVIDGMFSHTSMAKAESVRIPHMPEFESVLHALTRVYSLPGMDEKMQRFFDELRVIKQHIPNAARETGLG